MRDLSLIRVSKQEKDYLIEKGYITIQNGRFVDNRGNPAICICNKGHKSKDKTYYVLDYYARCLKGRYAQNK